MGLELEALIGDNNFIRVRDLLRANFHLKLEFCNPAGSIEFKTAIGLVRSCEGAGLIKRNTVLVETSSGSLGVALAMICAERGYRFECVIDPNTSAHDAQAMRALGADVTCVPKMDAGCGYLEARLKCVRDLVDRDARYVWISQHGNRADPEVHAELTAAAIAHRFSRVDYLFVSAETAGMLMGCARYFSRSRPETKIVAVDSVGSIAFDGPTALSSIHGPGASYQPGFVERRPVYATVFVPEVATVLSCRYLARSYGVLAGGSTGSVMTAVLSWRVKFHPGEVVVAIAPDTGEGYLETIYNDEWVAARFGGDALLPERYVGFLEECVTDCEAD